MHKKLIVFYFSMRWSRCIIPVGTRLGWEFGARLGWEFGAKIDFNLKFSIDVILVVSIVSGALVYSFVRSLIAFNKKKRLKSLFLILVFPSLVFRFLILVFPPFVFRRRLLGAIVFKESYRRNVLKLSIRYC